jgi:hypothetical protein
MTGEDEYSLSSIPKHNNLYNSNCITGNQSLALFVFPSHKIIVKLL